MVNYQETIWSDLFAGNRLTLTCLQPAVLAVESSLELSIEQRKRTLYRLDGGSGTDEKLSWLLHRGYHVLAKGYSGKRAHALARAVTRWDAYDLSSWLGSVVSPVDFGRSVHVIVRKRLHKGKHKHSYYITTLAFPSKKAFMNRYNQRGSAEIEQFREDKSGLSLSSRRKQSFQAQKAIILMTDLAHNLLADFRYRALPDSSFAHWGLKRIVRDLLALPGRLYFEERQLKRIELLASHPYANELIICLGKYVSSRFGD